MSRHHFIFLALAVATVSAACDRTPNAAERRQFAGRALKGALAYPRSTLIGISTGEDAAQIQLTSPDSATVVAEWFRYILPLNKWVLEHDAVNRDGSIVIYAKQEDRPLWITLTPNAGGPGSTYTMVGVVVEGDTIR